MSAAFKLRRLKDLFLNKVKNIADSFINCRSIVLNKLLFSIHAAYSMFGAKYAEKVFFNLIHFLKLYGKMMYPAIETAQFRRLLF